MIQSRLKPYQQMFLQGFMCRHICNATEVKELFSRCCSKYDVSADIANDAAKLAKCVNDINEHISAIGMAIKKGIDEDTGKPFYVLISTTEDPLAKFATRYKENELEFFKAIISAVVESESGVLSSNKALNLSLKLQKKMGMMEAQDLLDRLIEDKWLTKTDGKVWLSSRSMMELPLFIKNFYQDYVQDCYMCKQLVLKKSMCDSCDLAMHNNCAFRYFQQKELKCPDCNGDWPKITSGGTKASQIRSSGRPSSSSSS